MPRTLFALIRKELIALRRDAHGLTALFLLPVVFIIVMSMALKDVYSPRSDQLKWAVQDLDNSSLSRELLKRWQDGQHPPQTLPDDWESALREGRLHYVLQIRAGAARTLAAPAKPAEPPLRLLAEPGLDYGVFTALQARLSSSAATLRLQTLLQRLPQARNLPALDDQNLSHAERVNAGPRPTSVQHNVPAWLIFGMFFVMATIAGLFVEERQCGALNRLLSLGVSPLTLLLAKILPFMLINALQAALMLAVGVWLIPLLGGDALSLQGLHWPALLLMILAISVSAISLALLIATIVRSQAQASAIGPMLNILMAALGGIMVPTFVMPAVMQNLSRFSPMNWALEGLLDVMLRGGGLASIQQEVLQLLGLACATLALAYLVFRIKKP